MRMQPSMPYSRIHSVVLLQEAGSNFEADPHRPHLMIGRYFLSEECAFISELMENRGQKKRDSMWNQTNGNGKFSGLQLVIYRSSWTIVDVTFSTVVVVVVDSDTSSVLVLASLVSVSVGSFALLPTVELVSTGFSL